MNWQQLKHNTFPLQNCILMHVLSIESHTFLFATKREVNVLLALTGQPVINTKPPQKCRKRNDVPLVNCVRADYSTGDDDC